MSYAVHFLHEGEMIKEHRIKNTHQNKTNIYSPLGQQENRTRTKWCPDQKEWNEYDPTKKQKNLKPDAFHDTHLTTNREEGLVILAWIVFNNATKLRRLSSDNHLSFHVWKPEAVFFLVSAASSCTFTSSEVQNSDVAHSIDRVTQQLSLASMTWKRRQ